MTNLTLLLNRIVVPIHTLGPGPAIGLWVQGCDLACPGCLSPDTWSRASGVAAAVTDVADWMSGLEIRRLTVSGGEPTDQAPALAELIRTLRSSGDWTVTVYSGRFRAQLESDEPAGSAALLDEIDLLIDGPYERQHHAPLLWRGSSNQSVHHLSDRVAVGNDSPAGLEVVVDDRGGFEVIGVPELPNFASNLSAELPDHRVDPQFHPADRAETFPFPTRLLPSPVNYNHDA